MKTCCRCSESKPEEAYRPRAAAHDGLQYHCRACANAERAALHAKRPRENQAYKVAYRIANSEKVRAARATRYVRTKARENEVARAYKKANRATVQEAIARRTAAKLQATPAWASRAALIGFYETADALGMWTGEWHHVDHIVPLQSKLVCGLHCEANLQVLPGLENQRKGNRHWPGMPSH